MPDDTIDLDSAALLALANACAAIAAALRDVADRADASESIPNVASVPATPIQKPSRIAPPPKPTGQRRSFAEVLGRFKLTAPKSAKPKTNAAADAAPSTTSKPLASQKVPTPSELPKAASKPPTAPQTPKIPTTPAATKPAASVGVPAYAFGPKDEAFKPGKKIGTK